MYNNVWYANLSKPPLMPPNWLFTPVWIILYLMIFLSLLIFTTTKSSSDKVKGYIYFVIQMSLNIIWSPVFFLMKNIELAAVVIILLDIFIYLTIRKFHKVSSLAAELLYPYFVWVIFASYLNCGIVVLKILA